MHVSQEDHGKRRNDYGFCMYDPVSFYTLITAPLFILVTHWHGFFNMHSETMGRSSNESVVFVEIIWTVWYLNLCPESMRHAASQVLARTASATHDMALCGLKLTSHSSHKLGVGWIRYIPSCIGR